MKIIFIYLWLTSIGMLPKNDTVIQKKNIVYVEALGSGGLYSVNYERLALSEAKFLLMVRVGLRVSPQFRAGATDFVFVLGFNVIGNKVDKKYHYELGANYLHQYRLINKSDSHSWNYCTFNIGIRKFNYNSPFFFAVRYSPIINLNSPSTFSYLNWGGISVGIII